MIRYCDGYWNDVSAVASVIPGLEELYGKRVFLTGATGMICSAVADILFWLNKEKNAGIGIYLAGRSEQRMRERFSYAGENSYTFVSYDATQDQALDVQTDYVIHGASNANPGIYTKQPVETMLANIVGLNSLLSMSVKQKVQRLLYISSSEVYGNLSEVRPYRENDYGFVDLLNPRASYPSAKRAAETLCVAYGSEFGLDTVIVRPGHIYGPSITGTDTRASAEFTRNAAAGEDIVMKSAGTQWRSYCYTLDCASAILTVLLRGASGNAYNISNRDSVCTISEIAEALAKSAGRKVVFQNATEQEKKGFNLMSNSSLDASKLEALGWKAVFDLADGTERTVRYFAP